MSPIGSSWGNIDIINECMKHHEIDSCGLDYIIQSHNNEFLEYLSQRDLLPSLRDFSNIIRSQNLKALFIFYELDKNSVIPWCGAFSQAIDIIHDENLDFNRVSSKYKGILHYATSYNNIEICKHILNSMAIEQIDINDQEFSGKTALYLAVKHDNKEITDLLISHGADVNIKNSSGMTALHRAVKNNNKDIAELLISHVTNINEHNKKEKSPLYFAVKDANNELPRFALLLPPL
ncbi:ankyrin repeat protein, putative [Trichomonas vaginalis G3]|uniref:Ankyrin repeat protein, putative n=1 Tax=Trichomonas vaginalis (strain ATCC PRA-98 / G3) TaxID=412133 RepID=A2E944_TRIV3|nr:ATP binding [Trichomonas vaginalis G3]EAY10838.1 ankyrin repeat protein, putative [Trichomonas vaginalis G3]KAI5519926.1 ATP binding [Trichomonas vaginalis G3]|eukprot:XP_001323061.1 ankyrin repeat protein [Trichomonas vaginalis G3]